MESLKDRWFQADNPPPDHLLNEQEFLSFLHPEHSRGMLKYMVKEIVRDLGTVYIALENYDSVQDTIKSVVTTTLMLIISLYVDMVK